MAGVLLERLRNYIPGENDDDVPDLIREAADEIEQLSSSDPALELRIERILFDRVARNRLAGYTVETAQEIMRCVTAQSPAAWIVRWSTPHSGPQSSAYLSEDNARHAANNLSTYAHATDVEVVPVYAKRKQK